MLALRRAPIERVNQCHAGKRIRETMQVHRPFTSSGPGAAGKGLRTRVALGSRRQCVPRASSGMHPSPASTRELVADNVSSWPRHAGAVAAATVAAAAASTLAFSPSALAETTAFATNPSIAETAALLIPGLLGDSQIREGFVSGFLLIFFSEIGDKTFFIALLLALRQPKGAVFIGTFGALAVMTLISVGLGQVLHQLDELVPQSSTTAKIPYDDLVAAALLVWFGIQTLKDAKDAAESAAGEKEEAQEVVNKFGAADNTKLILSTFALVFAAEWGDKSFLATIALAAASSPVGVVTGAVAGHGLATGIAVAGGSFLSRYFSTSALQYVGGSLFLVFAAATVVDIFAAMSQ